ncbi:arginase [Tistrella mobilis]|uniref:arginase n=1 Tax=Tistrella mobilis TaxID=171437 RepID=UPI0031F700C7
MTETDQGERPRHCRLIGVPLEEGAGRRGCAMGPAAFRTAGIVEALAALGHRVTDEGDLAPRAEPTARTDRLSGPHDNPALKHLARIAGWTAAIADAAFAASAGPDDLPVFLGGDHALAAGTLTGLARRAAAERRPFFVLWLDAHPDFHTLETTVSGNLHGVPMAYATGRPGFAGHFPEPAALVDPAHICMIGIRSVDAAERGPLAASGITVHDMRRIDEHGMVALLRPFLDRVQAAGGRLHLSLDVDFLDPAIAPGVGTTVPGGASFREAHLVMEMLHEAGLVDSVDLVELNPFLDERGRTALLMVDLLASLLGRRVMDYPTRSDRS